MALSTKPVTAGGHGPSIDPLEAGKYDAVLSAIISLGFQKTSFEGNEKIVPQVKLLFEIPEETFTGTRDGKQETLTQLLAVDVTISGHEKSKLNKIISALLKSPQEEEAVLELLNTDGGTKDLLGKACVLLVNQYKTQRGDMRNGIKSVDILDKRLPQPAPVREPFLFEITDPDLNIFTNKLSKWTRDKIMTCVNSDELPKALHKAYRDIKEKEVTDQPNGG